MAENVLGRIILEAGNKAMGTTGGGAPPISGLLEGGAPPGGGGSDSSKEASGRRFQKGIEAFNKKSLELAKAQPRWFTSMFKKMGIQMGLAGILKQSQIFTSTVGALFQIFGAFVDVLLAPLIRPLFLPILRWLARRIPDVSRASKAFFNFVGTTGKAIARFGRNLISGSWWTKTVFGGLISFLTETLPNLIGGAVNTALNIGGQLWGWVVGGLRTAWNSTLGGLEIPLPFGGKIIIPTWGGGAAGAVTLGKEPLGETKFHEEKVTGAGKFLDSINDTVLNTLDKSGKLLSTEDLTTIEGAWQANTKVDAWLASKGAETTSQLVERQGVTHEGAGGKSWFEKIFNPEDWSAVFGDFKTEFKNFWSGSAMSNVIKGAGVAVGGSLAYNSAVKMARGLGEAFKAVTWPVAKIVDLLNAAAKTPGMMGLNTAKWAVRQLNMAKGAPGVIGTLKNKGLSKGAIDLSRRALTTMGSGIGNATMDAWNNLTNPVRTAARAAAAARNMFRGGDAAAELGNLKAPLKNPPVRTPGPTNTGPRAGPDVANQGKVQKVLKKFGELKTKFTSMIRGKAGWTISKLKSSFGILSSLSDEVMTLAGKASLPRIVTYARFIKSLGARLLPFAATAVALGQTGFNIKQIASRNDLSWFSPDAKLLEDRMQPILDMINKGEVGAFGWAAAGAGLNQQALRTVMGTTKAGGIGTQAVLGGLEGILGLGGASTMPLQAALMLASMGHMSSMSPDSSAYAQTVDLESFLADAQIGLTANELTSAVAAGVAEGVRNSTMHGTMDIVGNASMDWL